MICDMKLTTKLWQSIEEVYARTLEHPFVRGLTDGSLPVETFRFYVVQDAHYLRDFARGLALLGAKAGDDDQLVLFCEHARNAILVERSLHDGFFREWDLRAEQVYATPVAPTCLLYTSYLMRVAHERPYHEGLGAFLPCYWVYLRVGKELERRGSPDPLYQRWINTYASEEFEAIVDGVLHLVDAISSHLTAAQRADLGRHFVTSARLEYHFWDMAWRREQWLV